jgi:hypothetical protein
VWIELCLPCTATMDTVLIEQSVLVGAKNVRGRDPRRIEKGRPRKGNGNGDEDEEGQSPYLAASSNLNLARHHKLRISWIAASNFPSWTGGRDRDLAPVTRAIPERDVLRRNIVMTLERINQPSFDKILNRIVDLCVHRAR